MAEQYTLVQFGQRIKAKYPQYRNIPDEEIARKVLAKYPQYQSSIQPSAPSEPSRYTPEDRTVGNYAEAPVIGIGKGVRDLATGLWQSASHPIKTAEGMYQGTEDALTAAQKEERDLRTAYPRNSRKGAWQDVKNNLTRGTAAVGTFLENAPMVGPMVQRAESGGTLSPESVEAAFELGTNVLGPEVAGKGLGAASRVMPEALKRGVRSAAGAGPKAVRGLVEKTKEANKKIAEATKQKTADIETSDASEAARRKAEHESKQEKANAKNAALKAAKERKAAMESLVEGQEEPIRERLAATEKAVNQRANANYNALREKLGEREVPAYQPLDEDGHVSGEPVPYLERIFTDGADAISDWKNEPTLLKNLKDQLKNGHLTPTWGELQDLRSLLNREIYRGTLPPDQFTAYKAMLKDVDEGMQQVADAEGLGSAQADARTYYSKYADAFLDRTSPLRRAIRAGIERKTGSLFKTLAGKDAAFSLLHELAADDPQLAGTISHLTRTQDAAAKMKLGEGAPAPAPPQNLLTSGSAAERAEQAVGSAAKIGPEELREAKLKAKNEAATRISHRVMWAALTPTLIAIEQMVRLHGISPGEIGAAAVGTLGMAKVGALISKLFENPSFVDFVTRATPQDVAQIPSELRGDFPRILTEAQKRGIKVSPALTGAFTGAAVAGQAPMLSKARQLQATRNAQRYTHTATNPATGHRIGSNDGQTWYDVQSGQQVQ